MFKRFSWVCAVALMMLLSGVTGMRMTAAQPASGSAINAWAPKPARLEPYQSPNRALWRLSDILSKHQGEKSWRETVVVTGDFTGQYVSMAPGDVTKPVFYSDDRVFWVVEAGQVRFSIEGVPAFVATKGFLVQVPPRVPFTLETLGNIPSLRFEVHPSEPPNYPLSQTPDSSKAIQYIRASFRGKGTYDGANKPYLDFQKEIVENGQQPPSAFLKDPYMAVEIFRGPPQPARPSTDLGHFRANYPGCWFVLEGEQDFRIEGEAPFTAYAGDVVFAPVGRWHWVGSAGTSMSTRLAINARPGNLHWYPPDAKPKE